MKEYICIEVPADNGGYLEIEKELIRCKDCKYYSTCLIRVSLPVENDYCGNAKREESEE